MTELLARPQADRAILRGGKDLTRRCPTSANSTRSSARHDAGGSVTNGAMIGDVFSSCAAATNLEFRWGGNPCWT